MILHQHIKKMREQIKDASKEPKKVTKPKSSIKAAKKTKKAE